jgi:hypothetical protein
MRFISLSIFYQNLRNVNLLISGMALGIGEELKVKPERRLLAILQDGF